MTQIQLLCPCNGDVTEIELITFDLLTTSHKTIFFKFYHRIIMLSNIINSCLLIFKSMNYICIFKIKNAYGKPVHNQFKQKFNGMR